MSHKVISLVAKGSFGECYKVEKDDKILCQKKIDLCNPKVDNEDIKNELSFLGKLDHQNIIKLYSYELGKDMMLSFFMELCYCSLEPHFYQKWLCSRISNYECFKLYS